METKEGKSAPSWRLIRLASLGGLIGVGLGAIGGHALEETLQESGRVEVWQTATRYLLIHAVAALTVGLADGRVRRGAGWLLGLGGMVFAGSLYALCLSGVGALGAITPLGGLLMMAGWIVLAVKPR